MFQYFIGWPKTKFLFSLSIKNYKNEIINFHKKNINIILVKSSKERCEIC